MINPFDDAESERIHMGTDTETGEEVYLWHGPDTHLTLHFLGPPRGRAKVGLCWASLSSLLKSLSLRSL